MKSYINFVRFFLLYALGVFFFNVSLCAQDSSIIGQPIRIIRSYDPNLPDWFRHTSDPMLIQESVNRIPQEYRLDSLNFRLPFVQTSMFEHKILAKTNVSDLTSSSLFFSVGGNPGSNYNINSSICGPFKVGGQRIFGLGSVAGNFGYPSGKSISDSIRSLLVWTPQFFLTWKPNRSNWDIELDGGLRSTVSRGGINSEKFDFQSNNFRISPRATYVVSNPYVTGLIQTILIEGFITHFVTTGGGKYPSKQSASELSANMYYEASYSGDNYDAGIKVGLNRGLLLSNEFDSLNGKRGTFSFKPHWSGVFDNFRLRASLDIIRQVEYKDIINKDVNWLYLPNLNFQYRPGQSKVQTDKGTVLLEFGLNSRIYQPSFYHWSALYPTLSRWDNYRASIQNAELFVRVEHGGIMKSVQWQHRLGLGKWNNPRFFGLDSSTTLGVSTFTMPTATQLFLETKINWVPSESTALSLTCGLQGMIDQGSWLGMPGLQPSFWVGIRYDQPFFRGWKLSTQTVFYAISTNRAAITPTKAKAFQIPLNLDLKVSKSISKDVDMALVFRQREAALWMLWAEDIWWGKFFNLELRWKI